VSISKSPVGLRFVEPSLVFVAASVAALFGFARPLGDLWVEELLDLYVIGSTLAGILLTTGAGRITDRSPRLLYALGVSLIVSGLTAMLGHLLLAAAAAVAALAMGAAAVLRSARVWRHETRSNPWSRTKARLHDRRAELSAFMCLVLALETWETVTGSARSREDLLEIGIFYSCLAAGFLALVAIQTSGAITWNHRPPADTQLALHARRRAVRLLVAFAGLALAIQVSEVQALDLALARVIYHCGGMQITQLMRKVSNISGRELVIWWAPAILLAMLVLRRRRSAAFFAAAMLGTVGLELLAKAWVARPRPIFSHAIQLDSFPSGHTLAATILAGSILVIGLPACRANWQKALLWSLAAAWTLAVAFSRVYLGRHYPADVVGGILLGAAWVTACQFVIAALNAPSKATVPPEPRGRPNEITVLR